RLFPTLICLRARRPPTSSLFPYTTLFRSYGIPVRTLQRIESAAVARRESHEQSIPDDRSPERDFPERHQSGAVRLRADTRASGQDRKSTRLNSSHGSISYAVFCLKKKTIN